MADPLLEVRELQVRYPGRHRGDQAMTTAVAGVDLEVDRGETLGLVGESGSGKSTIGNAILGLVSPTSGRIVFDGKDITRLVPRQRRRLGQRLQVVFQNPYSSLNPSRSIGQTLTEPLRKVQRMSGRDARQRASDVLARVGMPADAMARYPAEFSGGQRQRIAIARALVMEPDLVICDEPTSALDLSVQAHILNLLLDLQQEMGLSYLFISHDIDVVHHMARRVAVLLKGRIVEQGTVDAVIRQPENDYTRALIAAVPAIPGGAAGRST